MTCHAARRALGAVAVLTLPALLWMGAAVGDHACPLFERKTYDLTLDRHLGGDLYAVEHLVGFVDFKECHELRHRVTRADVRFEARGGAYLLRVAGEGIDDLLPLRPGANATGWYDQRRVDAIQYAGLSGEGDPVLEPGDAPPRAPPLRDALRDVPLRDLPAWGAPPPAGGAGARPFMPPGRVGEPR